MNTHSPIPARSPSQAHPVGAAVLPPSAAAPSLSLIAETPRYKLSKTARNTGVIIRHADHHILTLDQGHMAVVEKSVYAVMARWPLRDEEHQEVDRILSFHWQGLSPNDPPPRPPVHELPDAIPWLDMPHGHVGPVYLGMRAVIKLLRSLPAGATLADGIAELETRSDDWHCQQIPSPNQRASFERLAAEMEAGA